jgi:hypothetical protein
LLLSVSLVFGVYASAAQSAVTESTDPARVAAVEKKARELKERLAQEAKSGPYESSPGIVRGQSDKGLSFLSGGVSVDDRTKMYVERGKYSLLVATVGKGAGNYLAGAHLSINTVRGQAVVLDRIMDGPWLFAALPPGRYDVHATMKPKGPGKAQTLIKRVNVTRSGQSQAVLRFTSSGKVPPEMQNAFMGNPFGKPPVGK